MLAAVFFRFLLIFGLGILAFITFLVAGTLLGLMWLDAWRCGDCMRYPVGLYILGLLGLLILGTIGFEASAAAVIWRGWFKTSRTWFLANITTVILILLSIATFFLVINWPSIADWWNCLW